MDKIMVGRRSRMALKTAISGIFMHEWWYSRLHEARSVPTGTFKQYVPVGTY
jgi:hypothetical protein